jgi:hypothetical protein
MGYQKTSGEFAEADDVVLFASAARTASANGTAVETDKGVLRLLLDCTAASGTTPTLDITIETRANSSDTYRSVGTFTQVTAAGSARKCFSGCDREVRAVATIGGTTPSFTFSLSGEAV